MPDSLTLEKTPENVQRVGFLALVPDILRRFGADPAEILAAAGLSPRALDDPEATIPYEAMGRFLNLAADRIECPHLGLEVGRHIRTGTLGLIGELMRNAPTLGDALRDFAAHQHRNAHGGVAYLQVDKHQVFFGYAVYQPNVPGNHLICDGAAMAAFNIVCELAGPDHASAIEVLFSRAEPPDLKPWQRAFRVKLRFNASQTAVCFPLALLDQPVPGADAGLRKILKRRVAALWYAGEFDTVTQLRHALRIALLSRRISGNEISAQLGMSRRTLHRRLEARGLRFQQVLDETRCEFARQLLANTRLGVGEIGLIVGYSDPGVFTRGFARWAGMPPSEWRSNAEAGHPKLKSMGASQ